MSIKKFVMALDAGTSSSRAIVFDHERRIAAVAQREFRQIYPQLGWVEHDPVEIWETQLAVAREAMAKAFGREIPMVRMHGATDARHFTGPGAAPVAMIGVEGWRCHDEGEGATLASIQAYADLLVAFVRDFAPGAAR